MSDLPNPVIPVVPSESVTPGAEWPVLDPINTFDLVGPNAANRQPTSLKTRSVTTRDRLNKLIANSNYIEAGGPAAGAAYLPRDGSETMSGTLKLYDSVGAGATKHKLVFHADDTYMRSRAGGDGIEVAMGAALAGVHRFSMTNSATEAFYWEYDGVNPTSTGVFRVAGSNKIEFGNVNASIRRQGGGTGPWAFINDAAGVSGAILVQSSNYVQAHAGTTLELRADTLAIGNVGLDFYSGGTKLVEGRMGGWVHLYATTMYSDVRLLFGAMNPDVYIEWVTTPGNWEKAGLNIVNAKSSGVRDINIAANLDLYLGADAGRTYFVDWSGGVATVLANTGVQGTDGFCFRFRNEVLIDGTSKLTFGAANDSRSIYASTLGTGTNGLLIACPNGIRHADGAGHTFFTSYYGPPAGYLTGTTFEEDAHIGSKKITFGAGATPGTNISANNTGVNLHFETEMTPLTYKAASFVNNGVSLFSYYRGDLFIYGTQKFYFNATWTTGTPNVSTAYIGYSTDAPIGLQVRSAGDLHLGNSSGTYYITVSGSVAEVDFHSNKITNLGAPASNNDAARLVDLVGDVRLKKEYGASDPYLSAITVAKSGGDFTTIESAITYTMGMGGTGVQRPVIILVYAGRSGDATYTISNPITMIDHSRLEGVGHPTINISQVLTLGSGSVLSNLRFVHTSIGKIEKTLYNSITSRIENCDFQTAVAGISPIYMVDLRTVASDVVVHNCNFYCTDNIGNSTYGLQLQGPRAIVSGCHFYGRRYVLNLESAYGILSDCTFVYDETPNEASPLASVTGLSAAISACTFRNLDTRVGSSAQLLYLVGLGACALSGCTFLNEQSGTNPCSIYVGGSFTTMTGCTLQGVYLDLNTSWGVVSGNTIYVVDTTTARSCIMVYGHHSLISANVLDRNSVNSPCIKGAAVGATTNNVNGNSCFSTGTSPSIYGFGAGADNWLVYGNMVDVGSSANGGGGWTISDGKLV